MNYSKSTRTTLKRSLSLLGIVLQHIYLRVLHIPGPYAAAITHYSLLAVFFTRPNMLIKLMTSFIHFIQNNYHNSQSDERVDEA